MSAALIVIDLQQGPFLAAPPKHDACGLIRRINSLAAAVRRGGGTVIFVQYDGLPGELCEPETPGWHLLADLEVNANDIVVRKTACDAFLNTSLDGFLHARGIGQLIITGWATDYCVDTTVRSPLARGCTTIVPIDGHTVANRQHLSAVRIIEHHNAF